MGVKTLHDYNVTPEGTNPPRYYGGNYSPSKDELSQATFVPEFNKGYSIIATASHAWVWAPAWAPTEFISRGIIDYDGDGKTDMCVYRAKYGTWFILWSSENYAAYAAYMKRTRRLVPFLF
jgi:hypothetical protein